MPRKPYKRGDYYRDFQSVKTDAKLLRTMHDAEINRQGFEIENLRYQSAAGMFFSVHTEAESAFNAYIAYLAFFMGLTRDASADTDDTDSAPSIYSFAYKALVLFGTDDYCLIFATIDNLLLNTEGEMTRSIIQFFSSLSIPTYHPNINLSLWREWIRYENTKRALSAFAIADQIVALTGSCSGYEIQLTKNFPKIKNTKADIVYIHTKKGDPTQLGYAIKISETALITGTFDAQAIGLALFSEFTQLFQSAAISTSPTGHISSEMTLDDKIKIFNYLQRQHHDIALPRKKEFPDIEVAVAAIKYQRFHEMPEFAQLCSLHDLPEITFDHCLDIYGQRKQSDKLPNIIVNGADIAPDCKGFFLEPV